MAHGFIYGRNSGSEAFGGSFKPTQIVDPSGYVAASEYDALHRKTSKSITYNPGGDAAISHTIYDALGNPIQENDPLGHSTWKSYDALNRLVSVTYFDGTSNSFGYTATGMLWQKVDELGRETDTEYDGAGRSVKVTSPALMNGTRAVALAIYDATGNVVSTIDPLGNRTDLTYDVRNRKVRTLGSAVTDGATGGAIRPMTDCGYDGVGNLIKVIDARNYVTVMEYDAANRNVSITSPSVPLGAQADYVSPVTLIAHDPAGNIVRTTDANGHATVNRYDGLNRLSSSTDGAGNTVSYSYDAAGNKTAVTDGKGHVTRFAYDGLRRNTHITDAMGNDTAFSFDAMNQIGKTDADGQSTTYGYDAKNRLITVSHGANAVNQRIYAYDAASRLISVTESGHGGKTDVGYEYDALNRLTSEISGGLVHHYTYDLAGNRLQTLYGGAGRTLVSTYDALGRLQTVTESPQINGGRVTQYGYDASGNAVWKILPNGDTVSTSYDGLNRAVEIAGYSASGSQLYLYGNSRDLAGNVVGIGEETANLPLRVLTMAYDGANRLISEQAAVGDQVTPTYYTYDAANNRASRATRDADGANTTTYDYDACNRLINSQGRWGLASSYAYDANGSRISWTANNGLGASYGYDPEHRLISLWQNGSQYNYTYDYRTRRVERVEDATTTKVIFSGGTSVQEIESGATTVEYVRGSDWGGGVGGILYTLRGGAPSFTHYDARGDVTAKTDGSGAVTYQASYQAFGTRTQEEGATLDRQKANTKDEDPSGLLDEGQRYRDLLTDTFITADPAGFVDGPNLYAYVRQNPWTSFDPEGLQSGGANTGNQQLLREIDDEFAQKVTQASNERAAVTNNIVEVANGVASLNPVQNAITAGSGKDALGQPVSKFDQGMAVLSVVAGPAEKLVGKLLKEAKALLKIEKTAADTVKETAQVVKGAEKGEGNIAKVAEDAGGEPAKIGSTRHVELEPAENGAYTVEFDSGKTYDGKGGTDRARRSARQRSRANTDPVKDIQHTPVDSDAEAFKMEAENLKKHGGPESPANYNERNSPGKKLD